MMPPIIPFPEGYDEPAWVKGHECKQLWRARSGEREVALRLLRLKIEHRPAVPPVTLMPNLGIAIRRLSLITFPRFVDCGGCGDGHFYAEDWLGERDITSLGKVAWKELVTILRPIAADLATLHGARKWHGGIKPNRIRVERERSYLVGLPWTAPMTSLVNELFIQIESPDIFVAPEILEEGPGAASTASDVYSFARTLVAVLNDDVLADANPELIPTNAYTTIEAGLSREIIDRPNMREIATVLN